MITFANEKGGVGKSTLAFHCALALAHRGAVLAVDCDRRASARSAGCSRRARGPHARSRSTLPSPRHLVLEKPCGAQLVQEIDRLGSTRDFVLIDLAGRDRLSPGGRSRWPTRVVPPVNCSPTDLDALGWINPVSRWFRQAGPFAEVVAALREERVARGQRAFDWVVAKNRVRHCEQRLIAAVDQNLGDDGAASRLPHDRRADRTGDVPRDAAVRAVAASTCARCPSRHAAPANIGELRRLVEGLDLPQPRRDARLPARPRRDRPPACPAQVARSYREALPRRALPARPALA